MSDSKKDLITIKNDEPSQTSVNDCEAIARSNIESGQDGLLSDSSRLMGEAEVIDETVLTNADAVKEDTALTSYQDSQRTIVDSIAANVVKPVDANFIFPRGYFRVCERSVPIYSLELKGLLPSIYPVLRLDPANALVAFPYVNNKLSYARFIRYDLELQFKVLATNFHYGQIMVVWRSCYLPFVKARWQKTRSNMNVETVNGNWQPYGPYDSVYTASQLPNNVLPLTSGTSLTLTCPWNNIYQYVPTVDMLAPRFHSGLVDIYLLTPIMPTDIDAPLLQIFARFKNITGYGYRALDDPCATQDDYERIRTNWYYQYGEVASIDPKKASFIHIPYLEQTQGPNVTDMNLIFKDVYIPYNHVTTEYETYARWQQTKGRKYKEDTLENTEPVIAEGLVNKKEDSDTDKAKIPVVAKVEEDAQPQKEDEKEEKTTTEPITPAPLEVAESGEIDDMMEGITYSKNYTPGGLFAKILSSAGNALSYFGLSKPPDTRAVQRVINSAPPITNSIGPDFTVPTSYSNDGLIKNDKSQHSEKILITKMAETMTFLGYIYIDQNYKSWTHEFSPMYVIKSTANEAYLPLPAGYIGNRFTWWRGTLKYRFHFSSSSFVDCRFAIMLTYDESEFQPGIVPTQIVEVKGDAIAEGTLPFLHYTQWAPFHENIYRWKIKVSILDRPITWKNDEFNPVFATVWVGFGDFQVAQPSIASAEGILWGFGKWFEGNHPDPAMALPFHRNKETKDKRIKEIQDATASFVKEAREARRREVAESGPVPGSVSNNRVYDVGMNDIPQSVYHIAKRLVTSRSTTLVPFAPMPLIAKDGAYGSYDKIVTFNPNTTYFAALFRWVRGSTNFVSSDISETLDVPLVTGAYDMFAHSSTIYKNLPLLNELGMGLPVMKRFQESCIALRMPYRSDVPFLSGPHIAYVFDHQASFDGVHFYPLHVWFEPHEGQQGIWLVPRSEYNNYVTYAWGFGDDLCYNTFMGTPWVIALNHTSLDKSLYGPVSFT
uniref:Structural polyprotein n=1 Tax=Bat felisavirus TaxID=1958783 RepID=A0A1S5VYT8_9VIRU|nr:structural polyprotein [Bat felisavirus]